MQNKGRSGCGGFLLGVLLGPIGLIIALVLSPNVEALENEKIAYGLMKRCAACSEAIQADARKCRYCGEVQPEP